MFGTDDQIAEWDEFINMLDQDAFDLTNPTMKSKLEDLQHAIEGALERS